MSDLDLSLLSVPSLLLLHSKIGDELRGRGLVRSSNNPVGDIAEYLFCAAYGWTQATSSKAGYDAIDQLGLRYQIKSRRLTAGNTSRQMGALRNLTSQPFDMLAAVLFTSDFQVMRAALIPISVVAAHSKYGIHANAHRFMLHDRIWDQADVLDVTQKLAQAMP